MTPRLHTLRRHALGAARAAYRFCGPVAGAVQGELSKEERVRAISKAVIFGATSGTTLLATIRHPDTLTEVVVPLVTAALAGAMDAMFHHQTGKERIDP